MNTTKPQSQRATRRANALGVLALAVLATPISGCFWTTTKSEGQALRNDLTTVKGRLDTKEKELDTQIALLKKVLDEATTLLKKNNAGLGADVDQLRADVRTANGLVVSVNTSVTDLKAAYDAQRKTTDARLDAIEARVGQLESGKPASSSSPDELWRLATQAFEAQRYNDAIEIFKRLTQTYPTHDKADDAVYFKGQSYGYLKDWDHAIGAYQQLYDKYPESSLADDGLYFAGVAAKELKNCTEGRTYLGIVKTKYPKSNVSKQAADLDALLKKEAKNKAVCTT